MRETIRSVFLRAYLACALWSSTEGEEGTPLDEKYSVDDLSSEALAQAAEECNDFINPQEALLLKAVQEPKYSWASAGHDFWLTRNRHGAGFWDRGLPDGIGEKLSEYAKVAGSRDLYPGDDGILYFT